MAFFDINRVDKGCSSRRGGCSSGICVMDGDTSALCLCPDGMIFVDGKCTTNGTVDELLLYSRLSPVWIHGVHVARDGTAVTPTMPSILSPKGGAIFTVDSLKSEIYFYDDAKSAIYKRSLHGGNVTLITKKRYIKYATSLTYFADYLYVPSRADLLRVDTITSEVDVVDFHLPVDGFFINHNLTTKKDFGLLSFGRNDILGWSADNGNVDELMLYSTVSVWNSWIPVARIECELRDIGAQHLTCMAFDSTSGNLYYGTRPILEAAGITVFRPENPDKRLLVTRTVTGVYSLNVDPMLLFYSSTTQLRQYNIIRANLDGTNPTVLVSFFSFHPLTMALDVAARKVYWLDPFDFTLHRSGYDGEDNEVRSRHVVGKDPRGESHSVVPSHPL
ncbi:hypothetical protein COOONC_17316 [Cooperia oncophora]